MRYYDVHTHHLKRASQTHFALYNSAPHHVLTTSTPCSVGIHPWDVARVDLLTHWQEVQNVLAMPQVWAIGECGLDTAHTPRVPRDEQDVWFKKQVHYSEFLHKPLIVHCVRQTQHMLALRVKMGAKQPWIIHRFQGTLQDAQDWNALGCYVSFSPDVVLKWKKDSNSRHMFDQSIRFVLETDDHPMAITELYMHVAHHASVTCDELIAKIENEMKGLFYEQL